MPGLEEALVPFKETVEKQTSMAIPWDWSKSDDVRAATLIVEFKLMYGEVVEQYDFHVLSSMMGILADRKDKATWNPYFWEHWQNELTSAVNAYVEKTYDIPHKEERLPYFAEVTEGLAEVVEFARREPSKEFEKEILRWLDEKCNVVKREKLY